MNQFYRSILKRAFSQIRHSKYLWFFGFFAALLGNGGEIQMLFRSYDIVPKLPTILGSWREDFFLYSPVVLLENIWLSITTRPATAIPLLLIVLTLFVGMTWVIMVSQAALTHSAVRLEAGKKSTLAATYQHARVHGWSILVLNFLVRFALYGSLVILALPFSILVMASMDNVIGLAGVVLIGFIVTVPLAMIANFLLRYAVAYVVLDSQTTIQAFASAWQLFRNNWVVSLEVALLLFVINVIVGFGLMIALFFTAVPFLAAAVIFYVTGSIGLLTMCIVLAMVVFVLATAIVGAGLAAFQWSSWTILFTEFKKGTVYPKLVRMTNTK